MYLVGLGAAPFLDPPEGFHAAIAESLRQSGDWITLRLDGVRYFDKPPLLYWLMALSFAVGGPSEAAARLWPAAAAIGVAAVTGWIGTMLSGPRVGLLAGLLVAVNIGTFVFGREVKPDVVFVFFMLLAFAGFIVAYRGRGRWGLALFYASLGLAALTKDFLGAAAPLGVVVAFLWGLLALWSVLVVGFFTLSPFKLPHYGLPAFPALALLVARVWDESINAQPGAVAPRILIGPIVLVSALIAAVLALGALGRLPAPTGVLESVDVPARNLWARGQLAAWPPMELFRPIMLKGALVFSVAAAALAVAAWRRLPALGVGVALAAMIAFLPMVGEGVALFARARPARPIVEALTRRLGPGDVVVHEGPLENTGSLLLSARRPVHVVHGLQSNLAFG